MTNGKGCESVSKRNLLKPTTIKKSSVILLTLLFYILLLPIIVSALAFQQNPDCAIIALSRLDISQYIRMLHQPVGVIFFKTGL